MTRKERDLPWATGPGEILRHSLDLLKKDTDTNRRLAMIGIDNAVELMMKTYLGLPKRVTGLTITRREYQEISESFPGLLDALEKHAVDKLDGVDLGAIEWYHRLRNELYHQGNGLTVERDKVEIYAELANILFRNLFGFDLVDAPTQKTELLGEFMASWSILERALREIAQRSSQGTRPILSIIDIMRVLEGTGELGARDIREINELRMTRNQAAHGQPEWEEKLTPELVSRLQELARRFTPARPSEKG